MKIERWTKLMEDETETLTQEEIALGWHFCPDQCKVLMEIGEPGCDCELP
jgi:hypothetical protein